MILNLYSIRDTLNGFAPPVVMPNDETAKRWYEDMKTENPTIGNNPDDFGVHFIGQFDSETGLLTPAKKEQLENDLFKCERSDTE